MLIIRASLSVTSVSVSSVVSSVAMSVTVSDCSLRSVEPVARMLVGVIENSIARQRIRLRSRINLLLIFVSFHKILFLHLKNGVVG